MRNGLVSISHVLQWTKEKFERWYPLRMRNGPVFISHASRDDAFVQELRLALEGLHIPVWVDSRNLRSSNTLAPEIAQAIVQARQCLVVLSPNTINSPWVRREIRQALELEDLGERLPNDHQPVPSVAAPPVEDLVLELRDPHIETTAGKRRVSATATLVYESANPAVPRVESRRFTFTAPLGPIEAEDLRWYLESYYLWPTGVFKTRAERVETKLPQWGQELYRAVATPYAQEALHAWQHATAGAERRFSVLVDSDLPDGSSPETQATAREAATGLLALPWELLHDERSYLFQGQHAVRVRRRLPNRHAQPHTVTDLPIRILLVSPRPENAQTGYIDHRSSALPLVEAVESLGELATLSVLTPPTFPTLQQALQRAAAAQQPFELLALERRLHDHPYAVVRGQGGMGKTTLAAELARWLVRTGRFRRAAFVSLETVSDARSVLDSLGRQVLPEGANWSVAQYPDLRQALRPVQRALTDHPTLLVLDNLESVLPDASGQTPVAAAPVAELWRLCQDLLNADPATRLLFTSREALPEPFAHRRADMVLGALSQADAIALVSQVMAQEGVTPHPSDPGSTPQDITDLVEAVGRHPRALVLLAREVAHRGVRATTATVRALMAALHDRYPDNRDPALAADPALNYDVAAEMLLLLETLETG